MTATAKKEFPAWIVLMLIVLVAAVLVVLVNSLTADRIEAINLANAEQARRSVMSAADSFSPLEVEAGAPVDNCYEAVSGGSVVGHTAQVTVRGYGGPIEIIVGAAEDGTITGVSVGGSDFAETAGLGARVKEAWFRDQYVGLTAPVTLKQDVDAVSGATISSRAVTNGINTAMEYIASL